MSKGETNDYKKSCYRKNKKQMYICMDYEKFGADLNRIIWR